MSTVTPNFNWPVPTSTDLVKDGATAIEALGDSIDASLVDLKGGTTGQVLSKASNTDMDFVWVTDAAGDITGVTAGTGLTGGGTSGTVSLAFDQTNYGGGQYAAGKNKIINGDFGVWQRGTSFTLGNGTTYSADRWRTYRDGSGSTCTLTRETFTPGTAPVAGYEGSYFLRFNQSVAGTGGTYSAIGQPVEDVRTFAGQVVTVSFWAKSNASRNVNVSVLQDYGVGGSGSFYPSSVSGNTAALTTSWQRFNFQFNITATTGKTIGTNSYIQFYFDLPLNQTFTLDTWGWQVEAGSTATPFQTATGTIQGELAACQRYYYRNTPASGVQSTGMAGFAQSSTIAIGLFLPPVVMRTTPSSIDYSNVNFYNYANTAYAMSALALNVQTAYGLGFYGTVSGATAGHTGQILLNSGYIGFSAEL